jgi:hypothetical protein
MSDPSTWLQRSPRLFAAIAAGALAFTSTSLFDSASQAQAGDVVIPEPFCLSLPNGNFKQLDLSGNPLYWKMGTTGSGSGMYSNGPTATVINAGVPFGNAVELVGASKTIYDIWGGTPSGAGSAGVLQSDYFIQYGNHLVFDLVQAHFSGGVTDSGAVAYAFNVSIDNDSTGMTTGATIYSGTYAPDLGCNSSVSFMGTIAPRTVCLNLAKLNCLPGDKIRVRFNSAVKVGADDYCDSAWMVNTVVVDNVRTCAACLSSADEVDEDAPLVPDVEFSEITESEG